MKAQFIVATIVAGSVAVAAAQDPPPRPEQKPEKAQTQTQTVTVTGCLQEARETTPPVTGQPAQAQKEPGSSSQFVLAQAKVSDIAGAPGTVGTTGSLATADKFRLIGGKPTELKEHLNHRVEITGTVQPRSERGQEKGVGKGDPKKPSAEADLPALRVTGFKHLAETCGPNNL
jgi:hypothetical protein